MKDLGEASSGSMLALVAKFVQVLGKSTWPPKSHWEVLPLVTQPTSTTPDQGFLVWGWRLEAPQREGATPRFFSVLARPGMMDGGPGLSLAGSGN